MVLSHVTKSHLGGQLTPGQRAPSDKEGAIREAQKTEEIQARIRECNTDIVYIQLALCNL